MAKCHDNRKHRKRRRKREEKRLKGKLQGLRPGQCLFYFAAESFGKAVLQAAEPIRNFVEQINQANLKKLEEMVEDYADMEPQK